MKTGRFLAIIAFLFCISTDFAAANVRVYDTEGLRGAFITCRLGEFDAQRFAQMFRMNPKGGNYCSIKIPNGWEVDIDYYGYGWDDPRTRTYNRNVNRLGRSFHRIRVRRARPREQTPERACGRDWGAQIFTESYYKGESTCLGQAETILPTKKPKSFKVRPGFILVLFKQGQEVRRFTKNTTYFGWPFDYVRVQRDYGSSVSPTDGRNQGRSNSRSRSRRRKS